MDTGENMLSKSDWIRTEINNNEEGIIHRHQNQEMLFYQQVAKGNVDAVRKNCQDHKFMDSIGVGKLSRDPLQNLKYHFVVGVAMIARLCIDNGMEMERSFRLSDYYIQKLDDIRDSNEVEKLHDKMVTDYTWRMKVIRQSATYSRPVSECMNYIYAHLRDRITIEDLAEYTSNSTSYISRLFKEELDTSASDYIRHAKIDASKNLLRYSDYSLIDIANYFSFSSQSHFSQLFQKETGMTPKKYREKYYGTQWKGTEGDIMENEYEDEEEQEN